MRLLTLIALIGNFLILTGCQFSIDPSQKENPPLTNQSEKITNDTASFKAEYEALNGEKLPVVVPEEIQVHRLDFSGVQTVLEKGEGLLYFGFPSCPWCRTLLPRLFTAMKEHQIDDLYYYDPKEIRDQKTLDEKGNIITTKEGTPEYTYLLKHLNKVLPEYEGLNNPQEKRLYVPFLLVVKNGEILGHHLNTLEEQEDVKVPLTPEQDEKLISLLKNLLQPLSEEQFCSPNGPAC